MSLLQIDLQHVRLLTQIELVAGVEAVGHVGGQLLAVLQKRSVSGLEVCQNELAGGGVPGEGGVMNAEYAAYYETLGLMPGADPAVDETAGSGRAAKPDYKNWVPKGMVYGFVAATIVTAILFVILLIDFKQLFQRKWWATIWRTALIVVFV